MLSWTRVHRWLAIVLVVPLVIWSITGVLFHIKPGWGRAYDVLSAERPLDTLPAATPDALAQAAGAAVKRLEVFGSVLGPLYRVTLADRTVLLDASLHARSPLSVEDARALATDAIARSAHARDYGAIRGARIAGDTVRIDTDAAAIDVDRASGAIAQRGGDTDRIDWLYRLHYLSWTGNKALDRVLALVGLALIWVVMVPGLVLFVQRRRG